MSWRWYAPKRSMTAEEALDVRCPTCARPPKAGCVWITGKEHQLGQPAKRPHQDRFTLAWRRAGERAMHDAEAEVRAGGPGPRDSAVLRALQDHDRREHDQLRDWLARNYQILTRPTGDQSGELYKDPSLSIDAAAACRAS